MADEIGALGPSQTTATTTPTATKTPTATTSGAEDGTAAAQNATSAPGDPNVVERGNGTFTVLPAPIAFNRTVGRIVHYTVEIEGGLGVDPATLVSKVQAVLLDRRGWQTEDHVRFVYVSPAQSAKGAHVDIRVSLTSPKTTDELCAPLRTLSQVSCWNGTRSVLNLRRWLLGDNSYGKDLDGYRDYQINHEVGHGLGHGHEGCPGPNKVAPVMLQQTLGLMGCKRWAWPVPPS